jgi:hypothetical protein
MQSYKPRKKPFFTQLIESTFFQITVLVIVAVIIGQVILGRAGHSVLSLGKNAFRSQGISKSESIEQDAADSNDFAEVEPTEKNKVIAGAAASLNAGSSELGAAGDATTVTTAANRATGEVAASAIPFKLIFAEVPEGLISSWITESTNNGLYQSLPEYSVGILYNYPKKTDLFQTLKQVEIKIVPGSSNTNLAGLVNDDGSELIGFATQIDLKSIENDALVGHFNLTKGSRQGTDNYPSDFELPKGSAFFIVGTLKTENFTAERSRLQMPPFQILKSQDFMTHKTEFVIIVQPDYK